jgi:hypothetical protein
MRNHSEPLLPIQARQAIEDFIAIHDPDEVKDCLTDLLMEWICADVDYDYKHRQIIVVSYRALLDLLSILEQVKHQKNSLS